jgi:hypothetical protein
MKTAQFRYNITVPIDLLENLLAGLINMNDDFDIDAFIGRQPLIDFEGFSPAQMHVLLYNPFESERSPLSLNSDISSSKLEKSKFFNDILEYLNLVRGRQPMRLTQRGNLPRAFCRELVERDILEGDRINFEYKKLWREEDSYYISVIDIFMDLAGLTKKRHGKKTLTKSAEQYLEGNLIDLYHYIFRVYTRKLNWGYSDYYPDSWIIQGGFAFSIFLVQKYGDKKRKTSFYSDKFLRAFPAAIGEFPGRSYSTPEEQFHDCYSLRTFERFLLRFGLIEIETERDGYKSKMWAKKTDLIDALVRWFWADKSH